MKHVIYWVSVLLLGTTPAWASNRAGGALSVSPTKVCPTSKASCRPALLIQGGFDHKGQLISQFNHAFNTSPKPQVVVFDSFGGRVTDAIQLARLIRQYRLDTYLRSSDDCQSACVYAFAGGIHRSIEEGSYVGVHKHAPTLDEDNAQDAQDVVLSITLNFIQAQVNLNILVFILANEKVFELTPNCSRMLNLDNTTPPTSIPNACGEIVWQN